MFILFFKTTKAVDMESLMSIVNNVTDIIYVYFTPRCLFHTSWPYVLKYLGVKYPHLLCLNFYMKCIFVKTCISLIENFK